MYPSLSDDHSSIVSPLSSLLLTNIWRNNQMSNLTLVLLLLSMLFAVGLSTMALLVTDDSIDVGFLCVGISVVLFISLSKQQQLLTKY
jgi:hypothetical protein